MKSRVLSINPQRIDNYFTLSKKSLASFILAAKYVEPPLSGWFASMILLWASFTLILLAVGDIPSIKDASLLDILASKPPL